jgi:hypothetical protein
MKTDTVQSNKDWLASYDMEHAGFGLLTILNETYAFWETRFHQGASAELMTDSDRLFVENHAYRVISAAEAKAKATG